MIKTIVLASSLGLSTLAQAATVEGVKAVAQNNTSQNAISLLASAQPNENISQFSIFAPKAKTKSATIDYEVWDIALENVVLRLGQSIRVRARRPDPLLGTRRITGHKSAYRLEGSRVMFSQLNDEYKEGLTQYRKDLERIASTVDITRLDRKEQLAFWFNLHNVTVIEQIAHHYPVKAPGKLRIGPNKAPLDEAKILNIRNIPMSLHDIRVNIVYPNWSNPDVIYGFFRGDIGGPALQNYAVTSKNVDYILDLQANDFINSLRGFHEENKSLKVSTLYKEAQPFYFKSWPVDLMTHLRTHASPDVLKELAVNKPLEFDNYDAVVADLNGGSRPMTANLNLRINGQVPGPRISQETMRLLRELEDKTVIMKQRGMISKNRQKVTIEDIATIDVDIPPSEPNK